MLARMMQRVQELLPIDLHLRLEAIRTVGSMYTRTMRMSNLDLAATFAVDLSQLLLALLELILKELVF
jgi:hypothetical protein